MGKLTLFSKITKHPLQDCHFFVTAHGVISPTHNELMLTHLVLSMQLHFECVPLNNLCAVSFSWYTMAIMCPHR